MKKELNKYKILAKVCRMMAKTCKNLAKSEKEFNDNELANKFLGQAKQFEVLWRILNEKRT